MSHHSRADARACALLLLWLVTGCGRVDPAARDRIVERDQLRREVAGFKSLEKFAPGTVMDRQREVLVSVTDTLLRSLLDAAFPLTIALRNRAEITITAAQVTFRANVARVDLTGQVKRSTYPHIAASVKLRGALDRFTVDRSHALRARINIDDVELDTPTGTFAAFDPLVIAVLQSVVERSLPELTEGLPSVSVPVRLDQAMNLPAFGKDAALSIEASSAPLTVTASRVIAFQNRLWIALHVELGAFTTVTRGAAP
jgi:hypothetical protein